MMGKPELLTFVYSQETVICFLPLWKKRELSETVNLHRSKAEEVPELREGGCNICQTNTRIITQCIY